MKKVKFLFTLALATCIQLQAQQNKIKKAEDNFDNYAYVQAIATYESLVKKGYTDADIYKNLGNAYYLNANYKEAANWYEKLFDLEDTDVQAEYMYRYAQSLKSLEKYEESSEWMTKFNAASVDDSRAKMFIQNKDYLDDIKKRSGRYTIKNLTVNSKESDFAPSFYNENQLVFSSARDTGVTSSNIHVWNKKPFLDLYVSNITNGDATTAAKFSKKLNKKTHESSTVFTPDGITIYFTRNNSKNGSFARDENGVSRLKIYRAQRKNGVWRKAEELPFNSNDYSVAHPTLSADGKKLYFASDMPGTLGGSDIFVVDILEDGSFGTPKNLGNKINTEGSETFPFVTKENVLYFASNGHPGLGGLDIFATKIDDLDNIYVVNIGKPVNSIEDDFSFVLDTDTKRGFFASNREGGKGSDDIYGFIEDIPLDATCKTLVSGTTKDEISGALLANAKVTLFADADNSIISSGATDANGAFSLEGSCKNGSYTLVAEKEEYNQGDYAFTVSNITNTTGADILLKKEIERATPGTDLISFLHIRPVYFDLDKSAIRPDAEITLEKIIAYLELYGDIKIEVQSHTDAKASQWYNNLLSKRRATSTVQYLIDHGIDASRLSGKGFGETQLTNECTTREKCTDDEHQLNRRSEFIVVE